MKRIVSVWFNRFPLNRLRWQTGRANKALLTGFNDFPFADDATPFALIRKDTNCLRILALNDAARRGGLHEGMRLHDACSLLPELTTQTWDREADLNALGGLAEWCQRYTPTVGVDGEDGLWLDVTGAAHLCGGEEALLGDLRKRLNAIGFTCRMGLAETPGAAWAVAHFSGAETLRRRIVPPGGVMSALGLLPLASLRLEENALYLLKRFGFETVAELYKVPRVSLKRRFPSREAAEAVLHRLDEALGHANEPLVPLKSAPLYQEHFSCAEPILATESFCAGLKELLTRVCRCLEKDLKGATALTYRAFHADGGVSRISIATAMPSRNMAHLMHLFRERIETINPGFGVDHLVLSIDRVEHLATEQLTLAADPAGCADEGAVSHLIDRLSNRLGVNNVGRIVPRESHIPERAQINVRALGRAPEKSQQSLHSQYSPAKPLRPFRLLARSEPVTVMVEIPEGPPMRFTWRRVVHRVARAEGPERIAPEWWSQASNRVERTRDYYRVEDTEGRKFWLFREGLYRDGGKHLPTWHIHGVFA